MLTKEFDNPNGHKAMRTLLRILLMVITFPMTLVFGGTAGANPILSSESAPAAAPEPAPASTDVPGSGTEPPAAGQPPVTPPAAGQSFQPFQAPGTGPLPGAPAPVDPTALIMQKFQAAGLTKFTDIDGFIKSYQGMEQLSGKHTAERTQFQTQLDNLTKQVTSLTSNPNPGQQPGQSPLPGQQQPPAQLSPDEIAAKNQAFVEKFMEDPFAALNEVLADNQNKLLNEGPLAKLVESQQRAELQETYNSKAKDFALQTDESGQYVHKELTRPEVQNAMAMAMDAMPALAESAAGFEIAYRFALGSLNAPAPAPAPIDPATLVNDDNFINTHVMGNEKVMNMVVQSYLQKVKDGQPPITINSAAGGSPPAQPGESPKNTKDASNMIKRAWGLTFGK